jgi:hypothetical protein
MKKIGALLCLLWQVAFCYAQTSYPLPDSIKKTTLTVIPPGKLLQDFDLLISALQEAHTGLYWYNTHPQFDSICNAQRVKIKQGMNELEFYNIIAPIVAFTREGHTFLNLGTGLQTYMKFSAKYFPVYLKFLQGKAYIINDIGQAKLKGLILTSINGRSIGELMEKFMSYEPADGYNTTSKYRWIEQNGRFSTYYTRCYPPVDFFNIEVVDPSTGQEKAFNHIASITHEQFIETYKAVVTKIPGATYTLPGKLNIDTLSGIATLTINSFKSSRYKNAGMIFHSFIDSAFTKIREQKAKHLIIDIRKNGGGSEGYEDYLLAYLIEKDYLKYKYVQASAFSYSFYQYTDYKDDFKVLEEELKSEHYLEKDGRILRKAGVLEHEKPKPAPFKGGIYILTSGLTYSGGSEFAALAKNHTNATFIGEETGGGYYGNTSGIVITLMLPNSQLQIGIPLLKFVVNTPRDNVPFGHGVLPDYAIQPTIHQFLHGFDAEMELAIKLIKSK